MNPWLREIRENLRLAVPIAAVQSGQFLMGFVDAILVGRHSVEEFAGISLGTLWFWLLAVMGQGTLAALDPLVSQARGRKDEEAAKRHSQEGLALAIWIAIPIAMLGALCEPVLLALGQPERSASFAADYTLLSLPGFPAIFLYFALRQALQAYGVTKPILLTVIAANVLNGALDAVLIYGLGPFPEMGIEGAAIASVASRIALAVGLFWIGKEHTRRLYLPFDRDAFRLERLRPLLRLGIPVGIQYSLEVSVFSATTLVIGALHGELGLSGHKAAIDLATMSFMGVIGISVAGAVRTGFEIGARDRERLRYAAWTSVVMGGVYMGLFGILFVTIPAPLATLFTDHTETVAMAASLIPIAGAFQVVDGIQAVAVGVLRGMSDTRAPMIVNLIGFWVIGFPLGAWLDHSGLGVAGRWWGLTVGLAMVALFAVLRIRRKLRNFRFDSDGA